MITCVVNEGDSITASVLNQSVATSLSTTPRCAYPWSAAGLTYDDVPGAGSNSSYSPFWHVFQNGSTICINRSIGGSRLQTNSTPVGSGNGGDSSNSPADLKFRAATWVDQLISPTATPRFTTGRSNARPTRRYILTIMVGTNTDTTNPTTHASNVAAYIATRRAAGWNKILLCSLISRTDGMIGVAHSTTFDTTYMQPYNAIVRDSVWQVANGVDAFADFASNANLGGSGAAENATYFADTVHPTQAGYDIMTPIYMAALNTLL